MISLPPPSCLSLSERGVSPTDSRFEIDCKKYTFSSQVYGRAGKPAVTSSKFLTKQHDVRRNKVRAAGFISALDSLDVADPVVANYLIDNIGVESVLLVPTHGEALSYSTADGLMLLDRTDLFICFLNVAYCELCIRVHAFRNYLIVFHSL